MIEKNNTIYFDTDDEFFDFCIVPEVVIVDYVNDRGQQDIRQELNYTSVYNNAVAAGKSFCIRDEKSKITKHQAINYKTFTKPVKNLKRYIDLSFLNEKNK